MLLAARRPVMFIGHGVTLSEAGAELTALAKKLSIPVISSPNGMGCLDMDDPLSLGFIGRNGAYPANQAGRHADLVLALGARFDDRSSSSWTPGYSWNFPPTKLIHVDVDDAELGRNYPPDLAILADAQDLPRAAARRARARRGSARHARLGLARADRRLAEGVGRLRRGRTSTIHASPMRPERVVADCRAVLPEDAIISLDSGVHHNWYMQFWNARRPQSMLNTWGYSGMGFGAELDPGRQARRAGQGLRLDLRRRRLHHGAARAVHRGRVQHPRGVGGVEQLRLGRDPRHPVRPVRRARDRHRASTTARRASPTTPTSPPGRAHGVEARHGEPVRGLPRRARARGGLGKPCLIDVHVDANIRPPSTGSWELPPLKAPEPAFGAAWRPE